MQVGEKQYDGDLPKKYGVIHGEEINGADEQLCVWVLERLNVDIWVPVFTMRGGAKYRITKYVREGS